MLAFYYIVTSFCKTENEGSFTITLTEDDNTKLIIKEGIVRFETSNEENCRSSNNQTEFIFIKLGDEFKIVSDSKSICRQPDDTIKVNDENEYTDNACLWSVSQGTKGTIITQNNLCLTFSKLTYNFITNNYPALLLPCRKSSNQSFSIKAIYSKDKLEKNNILNDEKQTSIADEQTPKQSVYSKDKLAKSNILNDEKPASIADEQTTKQSLNLKSQNEKDKKGKKGTYIIILKNNK